MEAQPSTQCSGPIPSMSVQYHGQVLQYGVGEATIIQSSPVSSFLQESLSPILPHIRLNLTAKTT